MAKSRKKKSKQSSIPSVKFRFRKQRISILLDRVLIFRVLQRIHGRFWGVAAILIMVSAFTICFLIRPDLLTADAALSYFGTDTRTAPYFAGAMFFAAYGLWRWRNYLMRTLRRKRPISSSIFITIIGLYLVALMPLNWEPVYYIHMFGMCLVGFGAAATVVADSLLTKTPSNHRASLWRLLRLISFLLIIIGGTIIIGSIEEIGAFHLMMIGELMVLAGFSIWVCIKTYMGEGRRSQLSRILKSIVFVD